MSRWFGLIQKHSPVIGVLGVLFLFALPAFAGRSLLWNARDGAIYAILAVSIAYLWRSGLVTFGHSLFFGVAAYVTTLSNVHLQMGGLVSLGAGVLAGSALAFFLGLFFVYRGLRGPDFTIFTLALVVMAELLVIGLWGNGGLVGNPVLGLGDPSMSSAITSYYLAVGTLLVIVTTLSIALKKRQRLLLEAIRVNEERLQGIGYNTDLILTSVFGLSGSLAAIAGALYAASQTHTLAAPDMIGPRLATEALVWAAIGGGGGLWRPALAAFFVWRFQLFCTNLDPLLWPLILGVSIIVISATRFGLTSFHQGLDKQWT